MNFRRFSRAKHNTIIGLSSLTLFFVTMYWILSSALLQPAFYSKVLASEEVATALNAVSNTLSTKTIRFSGQSLKDNAFTLIEGVIRFITHKDMSMASISLEEENVQSIRSAFALAAPETMGEIPDISRIHPYVLSYFLPGSDQVYAWLYVVHNGYVASRAVIPVFWVIILFLLLFPENSAGKTKHALTITGMALIITGFLIYVLHRPLFLSLLSNAFADAAAIMKPFISKAVSLLSLRFIMVGSLLIIISRVFNILLLHRVMNRYSRKIGMILCIFLFLSLILFRSEIVPEEVQTMGTTLKQQEISVLGQDAESVHSVVIKIREEGTNIPIQNVKLILTGKNGTKISWISQTTDDLGNVRFILPEGEYRLFAERSTVPINYIPFEPVTLYLNRPDSSWYTLHFKRRMEKKIRKTPDEKFGHPANHIKPLLK